MKNSCVINKAKADLANSGLIQKDEGIFTKNTWRRMGYKVNTDETPITTLPIYVYAPHAVYDEDGNYVRTSNMLYVWANFYKQSQVTETMKGGK